VLELKSSFCHIPFYVVRLDRVHSHHRLHSQKYFVPYPTFAELEAGLSTVRHSPSDEGVLEMIVSRPRVDARTVLAQAELNTVEGLVGDTWLARGGLQASHQSGYRDTQLTIMNTRAAALVAGDKDRWSLAGDQLYVDLNLGAANLPPGTRLAIGGAVVVVTAQPHTGCRKFADRFGADAVRFVNSEAGKQLNLRGINARVERAGPICVGDMVRKIVSPQ
jgi:hypothetical protein